MESIKRGAASKERKGKESEGRENGAKQAPKKGRERRKRRTERVRIHGAGFKHLSVAVWSGASPRHSLRCAVAQLS